MAWMNDDGLYVKFGTEEADVTRLGELRVGGNRRLIEVDLRGDELDGTDVTILSDTVTIPEDCFLEAAELIVTTAFDSSGDSATLTLGLYDTDRETAYDVDGIDATIAETAIDAEGDTITCDGDLIGTTLSNDTPCYIVAQAGTEAFTAGRGMLRIWYRVL